MASDYEKRLVRVMDHIHDNLDGDLSLDTLADVAALSRFHFHRVFHAMTGETVAQATRRLRLYRASVLLVTGDAPLGAVAGRCGYPNQASFSRAFREAFGLAPGAYRDRGIPAPPVRINAKGEFEMYDVEIRDEPARVVAGMDHRGDYMLVGEVFERCAATLAGRGLMGQAEHMVGLYFDDPSAVATDDLRSFAGFAVAADMEVAEPLRQKQLDAGRHAVLRHVGPYPGLSKAYAYLFGEWLPKSGEEPGNAPPFERYLNTPAETAPDELVTEISVLLK